MMKVIMNRDTPWKGQYFYKDEEVEIDDRHGNRWIRNKVARLPMDMSTKLTTDLFLTPQERLEELKQKTKILILVEKEGVK